MLGHCVVVGGGLGGLATAIRLQHAGWRVTLLEKNSRLGGRCNLLQEKGFSFDTGPTLLLMRDVLDDLFSSVDRDSRDYLELLRLHPNYRVGFGDGGQIEFSGDSGKMERDLDLIEPGAGAAFQRYMEDAGYKYRVARERFVERNFLHWYHFATMSNLYFMLRTHTLRKLDSHASRFFKDPRLLAAFTFQTMYLGLAPRQAPAVYSLLPYTELREGIWFPRGGMYRIIETLADLAADLGVELRLGAEVTEIVNTARLVTEIRLANGACVAADVIVVNADLPYAYESLIPSSTRSPFTDFRVDHLDYGSSAFLMYLGLDRQYSGLRHHDIYLSIDVVDNFDAIFRRRELPQDPSFYLCAASRTDPSLAPPGCEALYVLVPVPHASPDIDWSIQSAGFRDLMYQRLEATGLSNLRDHVIFERVYTPKDFISDYNIRCGSAFGVSHCFTQVGYMRPSNKAHGLDNLYFVGASTQPGGGIPMVIIGSRLTAERIKADHGHA